MIILSSTQKARLIKLKFYLRISWAGLERSLVKLTIVPRISGKQLDVESPRQRRRVEKRIRCNLSRVRITAEGDLETVEGYVVDVSKSGLMLRVDRYFRLGRKVAVEMNGLLIRGSIRYRCVQAENPAVLRYGLAD